MCYVASCDWQGKWSAEELMYTKPILFGDFLQGDEQTASERVYKPITDRRKLISVLEEFHMRQQMGTSQVF